MGSLLAERFYLSLPEVIMREESACVEVMHAISWHYQLDNN